MKRFFDVLRDYILDVDRLLLLECLLASVCGIVLISTATAAFDTTYYVTRQVTAICIGVFLFVLATLVDIRWVSRFWPVLLALNLALQLLPAIKGFWSGGNKSWVEIAGMQFQPGELGKVIFIVSFAGHIQLLKERLNHPFALLTLLFHWGSVTAFVVLFSRDDGQAAMYVLIGLVMLFAAGLKYYWFLAGAGVVAIAAPLVWYKLMDDYQRLRILVTFDPSLDADRAYQAAQTRKAIGSGLLTGKGYLKGTLTQAKLIPARHTDSIIAVAGEEFGLIGIAIVVAILTLIIMRCLHLAGHTAGRVDSLLCAGFAAMLGFQTVLNIGMNVGVLPVIGLTLPFISYGGTSIITMFGAMGIAAGVRLRSHT